MFNSVRVFPYRLLDSGKLQMIQVAYPLSSNSSLVTLTSYEPAADLEETTILLCVAGK